MKVAEICRKTQSNNSRIEELALPSLHLVLGVLKDHFRTLGSDRVLRLEELCAQIKKGVVNRKFASNDGILELFKSSLGSVSYVSTQSEWGTASSVDLNETREIFHIPGDKVIVANKQVPRLDYEIYSYTIMNRGDVNGVKVIDRLWDRGDSFVMPKSCRRKIEIVGKVETSTVLIQIHVSDSNKGIFVEFGLEDVYFAVSLHFHEVRLVPYPAR